MGSRPFPRKQMEDFKVALERNGLVDLGWKNQKYSWSNMHKNDTFTKECLDRVVATSRWLSSFNNPRVEVLYTSKSDHCPIILTNEDKSKRKLDSAFLDKKLSGHLKRMENKLLSLLGKIEVFLLVVEPIYSQSSFSIAKSF